MEQSSACPADCVNVYLAVRACLGSEEHPRCIQSRSNTTPPGAPCHPSKLLYVKEHVRDATT
eukprot:4257517-Amphidinium_carterae.1